MTSTLNLTDERREELAPKLEALLADLAMLEELDRPELEPATPWPWQEDDDDGR